MTEVPDQPSDHPDHVSRDFTADLRDIDHEIAGITDEIERHRAAWQEAWNRLATVRVRRQQVLWAAQAARGTAPWPAPSGPRSAGSEATEATREGGASGATGPARADASAGSTEPARADASAGSTEPARADASARATETSPRTAQNILFALGGLLLGTAAVVFTAVAWTTFGNAGRAGILAGVTVLLLTVPLLALRRGLRATAETFAVLGMLLVILDGYAAWYVNLFDAKSIPTLRYTGLVCAATAVVAALYRIGTRLVGVGLVAVLVVQPVLPLVAADAGLGLAGWAVIFAVISAANLVLVRGGTAVLLRVTGWIMHGAALAVAAVQALGAQLTAESVAATAWAAVAMLAVATAFAAGSAMTASPGYHSGAAAAAVCIVVVAGARLVAVAAPTYAVVAIAGVATLAVVLARFGARLLPPGVRPGLRAGSLVVAAAAALAVGAATAVVAFVSLVRATPLWRASLEIDPWFDWQLLAAVVLAAIALVASTERPLARQASLVAGIVLAVLVLPGCVALPYWAASTLDVAAAGGLALAAVLTSSAGAARVRAAASAVLVAHAVPASLARPENTAAVLAAVAVLGMVVAAVGGPAGAASEVRPDSAAALPERRVIGGLAGLLALLAIPPAVGASMVALDAPSPWVARLTAGSVVLLVCACALVRRYWPAMTGAAFAASVISAMIWPTVVALGTDEPAGVYAGGALVAVAAAFATVTINRPPDALTRGLAPVTALPAALLLAVDVLPAVLTVVALPYTWLDAIWSGRPVGVGLAPGGSPIDEPVVSGTHAAALGLLAIAAATTAYALRPRMRSVVAGLGVGGPTAVLVALTAASAPWPIVPATTLLLGLVMTAAVAVVGGSPWRTAIGASQGLLYVGAGLAGGLTVRWSTLTGLGCLLVAATVVAVYGVTTTWRVGGCLSAVGAIVALATAAGLAADLTLRQTAFAVLVAAALSLAAGTVGQRRRPAESTVTQAGAHAAALVALLFALASVPYAAAVCTLWGVAVGLRALAPGTGRAGRLGHAAAAAGWELLAWWLLLIERDVAVVEAYTLPLAAVALLAGWAALRARPDLTSWVAYGPALAAAFLPSLATLLVVTEPLTASAAPVWRRLMLGLAALAVVVAGSLRSRQAPVLVGGAVLAIVALHETVLFWDLAPRWIPPALGGLLLIGLAMTYERRRRDLARLRSAIGRMS